MFEAFFGKKFLVLLGLNVLLLVSFLVSILFPLVFLSPALKSFYEASDTALPLTSRTVILISDLFITQWFLIVPILLLVILALSITVAFLLRNMRFRTLAIIYTSIYVFYLLALCGVSSALYLPVYQFSSNI